MLNNGVVIAAKTAAIPILTGSSIFNCKLNHNSLIHAPQSVCWKYR